MLAGAPAAAFAAGEGPIPGLVSVQYHSASLTRPAEQSVDAQIDLDTGNRINDFSRLWLGSIAAPVTGDLTLFAEADNGCRVSVSGKLIIDGWSQTVREGSLKVREGERLPLRVEYFQKWGVGYMRLFWSWPGHARELIPASAFAHSTADAAAIAGILREAKVKPSPQPPRAPVPAGPLPNRSSVYGTPESANACRRGSGPISLRPGPQLFIDDYLVEFSENLTRQVVAPPHDPGVPNPVITAREDRCFQPFFTVLKDAASGRFRAWYGAARTDQFPSASHVGYLESGDGIRWLRPARILEDPGPIQFGSEVLDEGPGCADPSRRFKYGWWYGGGLHVAASADGFRFQPLAAEAVLAHDHDINNLWRDPLRNRYVATISSSRETPLARGPRRTTLQAFSADLLHWSPAQVALAADDRYDKDFLQFYAMSGFLVRGELVIGLVKVLHDDWQAAGAPEGAYGVGYTALAWTRDGEHWVRDREVFFGPDPAAGAWDHAHAWVDEQLPVGDEVFLYYGGYKWGHKHNRFEERQIGLVKMPRDRYVARAAGEKTALLRTPLVVLQGSAMTLNAKASGQIEVRLLDATGKALPGCDGVALRGDRLDHPVEFGRPLRTLAGVPVQIEFRMREAQLFGFALQP